MYVKKFDEWTVFHKENDCQGWHVAGEQCVIPYPSVSCIGFCRLTAGSILFSRSLLNSKASSTRNGFNNMSLWPHKMTQALWEASRFTRRRPRGTALLWDERRWSCSRRAARLQGRGCEGLGAGLLIFFWGCAEKSWSSSCWLDSGVLRFWPLWGVLLVSLGPSAEAILVLCSWCSRCFFAFSSYLQSSTKSFRVTTVVTILFEIYSLLPSQHAQICRTKTCPDLQCLSENNPYDVIRVILDWAHLTFFNKKPVFLELDTYRN